MTALSRLSLVAAIVGTAFAQPGLAWAYELRTHGEITRRAYVKSEGVKAYLQANGS